MFHLKRAFATTFRTSDILCTPSRGYLHCFRLQHFRYVYQPFRLEVFRHVYQSFRLEVNPFSRFISTNGRNPINLLSARAHENKIRGGQTRCEERKKKKRGASHVPLQVTTAPMCATIRVSINAQRGCGRTWSKNMENTLKGYRSEFN